MTIKASWYRLAYCLVVLVALASAGCKGSGGDSGNEAEPDVGHTSETVASGPVTDKAPTALTYEPFAIRAMWVWGSASVLEADTREELLAFASERKINRLYIEAEHLVIHEQQALADFIRSCALLDIDVELLFGLREWAFYENHYLVLNLVSHVTDFVQRYPDANPAAMHLDIEPYSLPEWKDNYQSIANQKLDLYEEVRTRLNDISLPLIVDIPIWFDEVMVTRNGEARPLHELIIDVTDGVALMDYRNSYDRIVNDARNELDYASRMGKTVVVGVETLCIEPASITFCGIGTDIMEQALHQLDQDMPLEYSAYGGHAIHHFVSYQQLGK